MSEKLNDKFLAAVQEGNVARLEKLYMRGADINAIDKKGLSALHIAALYNNFAAVQFLVENGADVNKKDKEGNTPVHYALDNSSLEMLAYLHSQKADLNVQNTYGDAPIHDAAKLGKTKVVSYLLRHGIDIDTPNAYNDTPLHCAARWGWIGTIKYLLEHNADVTRTNNSGNTPLSLENRSEQDKVSAFIDLLPQREEIIAQVSQIPSDEFTNLSLENKALLQKLIVLREVSTVFKNMPQQNKFSFFCAVQENISVKERNKLIRLSFIAEQQAHINM